MESTTNDHTALQKTLTAELQDALSKYLKLVKDGKSSEERQSQLLDLIDRNIMVKFTAQLPLADCKAAIKGIVLANSPFSPHGAPKSEKNYKQALLTLAQLLRHTSLEVSETWLKAEVRGLVREKQKVGVELAFLIVDKSRLQLSDILPTLRRVSSTAATKWAS